MPPVLQFMTQMPHTVGKTLPIKAALNLMREHSIRHLPVQEGGKLIGVLSDRDLKMAAAFKDSDHLTVEEIMTPDPYTVYPDTPIDEVVTQMAQHKYGCVIIQQYTGKVTGIFTATDGLRVLGEVLRGNFKHVDVTS